MMGHWFGNYGWIGMIISLVITIGVIIGIVFIIIWQVKELNRTNSPMKMTDSSSAKEILKVRYAKGEITRDEYLNLLTDLETR